VIERLRLRAAALAQVREFFATRGVLEVQTSPVVRHAVTDPNIESLTVDWGAGDLRYLHTSPEYAMKRLLAAGSGDIYQVCPVFRAGERSAWHSPGFTMIEWYRIGFNLPQLMRETAQLTRALLAPRLSLPEESELLSYAQAFATHLGVDVFAATQDDLARCAAAAGLAQSSIAGAARDELLDFLVASVIGPRLGRGRLTCLHGYPASQASLAQLDTADPRTALRFELYAEGVELANGFVELADAAEQRRRFDADNALRLARGQRPMAPDEELLAALGGGLPPCAGVALGFERVLMLASGSPHIDAVLALPFDRS
jgi:elongation factor P--(R)-beta-lysine ligase